MKLIKRIVKIAGTMLTIIGMFFVILIVVSLTTMPELVQPHRSSTNEDKYEC